MYNESINNWNVQNVPNSTNHSTTGGAGMAQWWERSPPTLSHQCGPGSIPGPGVIWVEFVVGSRPCSGGFSRGCLVFLPLQKPALLNSNMPFPSSLLLLFQYESKCAQNHSYENEFALHENEHVGKTHFHKNGFALRLILRLRQKRTRKWSVRSGIRGPQVLSVARLLSATLVK